MRFLLVLLLPLFLAACPTPYTKTTMVDGRQVVHHIDETDNPCGTRGPWAGCATLIDGVQHVWYSGVADSGTIKHELNHDKMSHGPWYNHRYFGNCAVILTNSAEYPKDGLICRNEGRRERIVPPGYHDSECAECLLTQK